MSETHRIDLDADPNCDADWIVAEHLKGGQFEWDAAKVALFLSSGQKDGRVIEGNKLRAELKDKPVFNANLLDYLLRNIQLIPEGWKSEAVFFWGTTFYRNPDEPQYVCYLYWNGTRWNSRYRSLGCAWYDYCPAAVRASN